MTAPTATLQFHQLRSGYEADKTSALTEALSQGQHLVIKGASGSGKTSLLRVMCALQPRNTVILITNNTLYRCKTYLGGVVNFATSRKNP